MLALLLVTYLPSLYAAFSRREAQIALLEARAGSPPSGVDMIERYHRIDWLDRLTAVWEDWEAWFADIEETHTSLPALAFFRSPQPEQSWVTAAGAVLDGAALSARATSRCGASRPSSGSPMTRTRPPMTRSPWRATSSTRSTSGSPMLVCPWWRTGRRRSASAG